MTRFERIVLGGIVAWTILALGPGCSEKPDERSQDRRRVEQPLQPLVYTEDPDHSPKAAAVRDRRLMRRLLDGSDESGSWGDLDAQPRADLPELTSAEQLGRVVYEAIIARSDDHWDHLFVRPRDYASLVHVSLDKARRYVDDKQALARRARQAFEIAKKSEAPTGGLDSLFSFKRLELGDGRTLQGNLADEKDDTVVQHWNNRLVLGLEGSDIEFHLALRKILRTPLPGRASARTTRLGVASRIELGSRLEQFLRAGMHLKPALLQSYAYPFPLDVGNYWRYARHLAEEDRADRQESTDAPAGGLPDTLHASRVTMRVESIDRYGTRRLAHLRFIYNDADLTRRSEYWLATPRRIFRCPRPCRRRVDDLDWLLRYLPRQTPLFRFPLSRGESWGSTFAVADQWKNVEVPGGSFFGTLAIEGLGPLDDRMPFHRVGQATRFFAPAKGVVKRSYQIGFDEPKTIVESLVDYRIMPH